MNKDELGFRQARQARRELDRSHSVVGAIRGSNDRLEHVGSPNAGVKSRWMGIEGPAEI
jgi:hypothetical protein